MSSQQSQDQQPTGYQTGGSQTPASHTGTSQTGGSQTGGSQACSSTRNITPAARYTNFQSAHRAITGQESSDIAEHEYLPDPSIHEDDDPSDPAPSEDDGSFLPPPEWFDQAFIGDEEDLFAVGDDEDSDNSLPTVPTGEEVPVSSGETSTDDHGMVENPEDSHEDSEETVVNPYSHYDQSDVPGTTSSGFNPALAPASATVSNRSNRSASIYRHDPEQMRRQGTAGRMGHRDNDFESDIETMYDGYNVESSGPSLPLPTDPPTHPPTTGHLALPDPSVSSVTNSQALLQGTISSPPARTGYGAGRIATLRTGGARGNAPRLPPPPPPLPRRSSQRNNPRRNFDEASAQVRALFSDENRSHSSRRSIFDDENEILGGPGPAVVHGVVDSSQRNNPSGTDRPQPNCLTVVKEESSNPSSRSASGVPSSEHTSDRDPFAYDRMFLPPEQERTVVTRLRQVTGASTIVSQSPFNSPKRMTDFVDIPLNDPVPMTTPSRGSPSRRRAETTTMLGDREGVHRMARREDDSLAVGRCRCQFPDYECRHCLEIERNRAQARRERDLGPYAPSPSYRMDRRGIRVAGDTEHNPAFYIGSPGEASSTDNILANAAGNAVTSPSTGRPTRALQRSDFSTFAPIPRSHRVNGRNNNSASQPGIYLGQTGTNRSQYELRDSFYDVASPPPAAASAPRRPQQQQQSDNWRSLTHNEPLTSPVTLTTLSADESHFGQLPFPLLSLEEAQRRQAEARSRGEVDQTFLTATTSSARGSTISSVPSSIPPTGPFRAFLGSAHPPRHQVRPRGRRSTTTTTSNTRTTRGRHDSFTSVMHAGVEEHLGGEVVPRGFLGSTTTAVPAPPTLHHRPPTSNSNSRTMRYGQLADDIELGPLDAGILPSRGAGNRLGRRWSA
ncbi:hypothetical protein GE09DRAFT_1280662 [Coniochaeta sp. 2T2.1]|nr:hypothetical protein GE09DRAFT_1280662 [Coniochaeta sp. 2T2.1]